MDTDFDSPVDAEPITLDGLTASTTQSLAGRGVRGHFARWERFLLVSVSVGMLGLLGFAGWLQPDESGVGTHRKLGFPACGAITMCGIPCPSCGMTTSWSWFARGHWWRSWTTNPGGFSLAIFVVVMSSWMGLSGLMNRWWPLPCEPYVVAALGVVVFFITTVQWIARIM